MTDAWQPARRGPGLDLPDSRGRTGLDGAGRDLTGNPGVVVRDVELLAAGWHVLRRTTLNYRHADGRWTTEQRETYDRGNGATVLLYDTARRTVLLTRQFRFPVYVNGHPDGMFVETAAGLLDQDDPVTAIRREAAEELGVTIGELQHVFNVWMSPGSVTEQLHFYAAPYTRPTAPAPAADSRTTARTSRSSSSTSTRPSTRSARARSPTPRPSCSCSGPLCTDPSARPELKLFVVRHPAVRRFARASAEVAALRKPVRSPVR